MKKITKTLGLILFSFLSIHSASAQCTHSIDLYDDWGDGWDGGTVDVIVGGTTVINNATVTGWSNSLTFTASTGDAIQVIYTSGGGFFDDEVNYDIFDGDGNTLELAWYPDWDGFTWNGTGFCAGAPASNPDDCGSAIDLSTLTAPYTNTTTGASNDFTACGSGEDHIYYMDVPVGSTFSMNQTTNSYDSQHSMLYGGACPGSNLIECVDDSDLDPISWQNCTGSPQRVYWIQDGYGGGDGSYTITWSLSAGVCPTPPTNDDCAGAIAFPAIPLDGSCSNLLNQTNALATMSSVTPTGACTTNAGTPDDDVWFSFVATNATTYLEATHVSGTTNIYWQVFNGPCAASMSSILCTNTNTGATLTGLVPGNTYYIRMYTYYSSEPATVQDICLHNPIPGGAGCVGATNIAALPYDVDGLTTSGSGDDFSSSDACGSSYMNGDDFVFEYTPAVDECIEVILENTGSWVGVFITDLCPDDVSSGCIASNTNSSGNPSIPFASLIGGTTYYITVSTYPSPQTTAFDIEVNNVACPVPPVNDDCDGATPFPPIPYGGNCATLLNQTNSLATASSVTPTGACTTNTGDPDDDVWFSFVATESTLYLEATYVSGTSNVYWQVFSSACNNGPMASVMCTNTNSGGTMNGLVIGNTYYIRMYCISTGVAPTVQDLCIHGDPPPTPGQDCESPLILCNSTISIGNPGYSGTGTLNDFTGTGNCTSGEKNSLWLQVNIASTGDLNFTIMPNDGSNNSNGAETDYDYLLWKMSGAGTTTDCSTIGTSSSTALEACNYNSAGVTGVAAGGNAPAPINSYFDAAFEPTVTATAGDVYYLVIQNFSSSTQGFDLDFTGSGAGVVDYTPPTTVYWTGGTDDLWTDDNNWGNCSVYPVCGVNAIVTGGVTNQPDLGTGTQYVNDLTINPGATLTIADGGNLHVCGDFTNYGDIVFGNNSTITFDGGNSDQYIYGNCIGVNAFGNFVINKTGGEVILDCNIEIARDFTNVSNTSILNINGFDVTVGRHFNNFNGNTTFQTPGTSGYVIFNGTTNQNYNQGASQLDLNNVRMNNTSTGVTLLTNMYLQSNSAILDLLDGNIRTNGFEVFVQNDNVGAITNHSSASYVYGNLRRNIQSLGAYEFPVGDLITFYQNAKVDFIAPTSINNLVARFDPYPGAILPQGSTECLTTYNLPSQDNGFWTINADANGSTGLYDMTLYPTNATNTAGANGWTVTKKANIGAPTWLLNGGCDWTSTVSVVKRKNMSGFSVFGAAQATIVLPSELIEFTGKIQGKNNLLSWSTAAEINNDYFNLERSIDGINFEKIAELDGAGNSNSTLYYESTDYNPEQVSYYRLEMVDFNDSRQYSNIVRLNRDNNTIELTSLYPNPSRDIINIEIQSPNNDKLELQLYDYTGKLVFSENVNLNKGGNRQTLDLNNFAKGIYNLRLINLDKSYVETIKVIKE